MRTREAVELTVMCALTDGSGNVLVIDRVKTNWRGIAFPGGHVEPGEAFVDCVIREMQEETGLTIAHPQLMGVKDWVMKDGARYMVMLYRANAFTGSLLSSDEGRVFWTPIATLRDLPLAPDISEDIRIMLDGEFSEHTFTEDKNGEWIDLLK